MPLLLRGRDRPTQRALALGGAGDLALLGSSDLPFTAGLGSFLAGHVAWVAALRSRPGTGLVGRAPWVVAPYLLTYTSGQALLAGGGCS